MTLQDADPGDISAFLDRRPFIGTYTNLHTFRDVCEYQAFRRYVKKDIPFFETPQMAFGKEAHTALEKRVGKGQVLPDQMRHWEKHCTPFDNYTVMTEQKLAINAKGQSTGYFDNDCFFRGQADVVVMLNEKALFTDWKSGNPRYADKFELETGALLLKAKFPQLRTVVGRFIFLKDDQVGKMEDLSNFQATWLEINRLMNLVAEKRQSGDWEKKKSGLCGYCPCDNCENYYVAQPK
jgi:hypothetical protein